MAIGLTQHHGFDRATVDGTVVICARDLFDAHDPRHIARLATLPADELSRNCGTKGGVGFKMVRGIFGAILLSASGFENNNILGHQSQGCAGVAARQRCVKRVHNVRSGCQTRGSRKLDGRASFGWRMLSWVKCCHKD